MKGILLALAVLFSPVATGQGVLTVDKTEIRIGDQVKATLSIDLSDGREWINTENVWPDSISGIEVVEGPSWNRQTQEATTATWSIAFFDTGVVRVPSLVLSIRHQGKVDTVYTNDIPIKVMPVEPDSSGLLDIKDIYKEPFNPGYYKHYIPHLIVFLLLIAGLFFWFTQRKSNRVVPEVAPVPLMAHEWAIKALKELAQKKLWQRGEIKEHYSCLTDILREYLERRFGIHAKEQISDEILIQLRQQHLSDALLLDIEELLAVSDLIKFAKADPGMDIHSATIERVHVFVAETTPIVHHQQPDAPKSGDDEAVE